jgi:very-short-patch-repair endonuclease
MKARWADPEERAKRTAINQEINSRPERRQHQSEVIKAKWADPEFREKRLAQIREQNAQPEYKAKMSESCKAVKSVDEAHKARKSQWWKDWWAAGNVAHGPKHHTAETRKKMSDRRKEAWSAMSPEDRQARMAPARQAQEDRGFFQPTSIEIAVGKALADAEVEFTTQDPIGPYFADILIGDVVVECDGDYWHSLPGMAERDKRRDTYMAERGLTVIRLSERDINDDVVGLVRNRVLERITDIGGAL